MNTSSPTSLQDFMSWHAHYLKDYLHQRGITPRGNKSELAALAYSCHVMNKPCVEDFELRSTVAFREYNEILKLESGIHLPDPFLVTNGWISEEKGGMKFWPPVTIVEIVDHFRKHTNNYTDKLLAEYKAGKAYDYFKTEWLKEISYNSVNHLSAKTPGIEKYCILKAKCTPSQRINEAYHNVWVCADKETGTIIRSYCSCTAG